MTGTMPTLKVALLGCGVVGSEVARLLTEQGYLEGGQGLIHPTSRLSRSSRVSRRTMGRAAPAPTATTAGRGTWL